jgi:transcriptional repressor NrdR
MLCPFCSKLRDKVIDSRMSKEGEVIRRRRHCLTCGRRFTTYERIDEIPYMVIKKDRRRERFDRQKVLRGLLRACEKRPVTMAQMQAMVSAAEALVTSSHGRECKTNKIGELLMRELRQVDKVAYVRFASVYRDFHDARQFVREIRQLKLDR